MRVAQAPQYSTAEGLEQPGFDRLKVNHSSFDFATLMGHKVPYGTIGPRPAIFAEERQK